jgi:predicted dehydrogenase
MFDVALVGFGYWGKKLFAAASSADSGIVVRCVVDADRRALGECPTGCRTYDSLDDALDGEKSLVGVVIATPIHTHYALAVKCLRLGLDVFVEKPLCVNSTQLDVLEFVADTTRSKLYCDYTIAISDKIEALKNIIGDESILHVDFRWESSPRVTNDNVVHDLFPHIVSIATALSPGDVVVEDAQLVEAGGAIVAAARAAPREAG